MDPLSASASIIAVLQMTGTVIQYINGVRGAPAERKSFLTELIGINIILIQLQEPAESAEQTEEPTQVGKWSETLQLLNQPNGPLKQLDQFLRVLESKLAPAHGLKSVKKAFTWPFQKEEVRELIAKIERQKTLLNLALLNDHLRLSKAMKSDVEQLGEGIAKLQIGENLREIRQWLSAPDPSVNHNAALNKRHPGTGSWFTESPKFTGWKTDQSSYIWLQGIPGCGKTVLSSTIIQNIQQSCPNRPGATIAYFYFNFNESPRCEKMLRSILTQLSSHNVDMSKPLESLYSSCQKGSQQPTSDSLLQTLHETIENAGEVFMILDALDECEEIHELLDAILKIGAWDCKKLHLLLTSRKRRDIDDWLKDLIDDENTIPIQTVLVNSDIGAYARGKLRTDRKLKRWQNYPKLQEDIEATLMKKAGGMFRWAVCQLDLLGGCLSPQSLRKALNSLPKDLDSTYDRILCNIDEEHRDHALKILQWLAYSARPLSINELAEVVAIDFVENPRFDVENRFQDPWDVMRICPSLITALGKRPRDFNDDDAQEFEIEPETLGESDSTFCVRLAHFSVKEYLVSTRIQQSDVKFYSIREVEANTAIAETCLAYLFQFDQPDPPSETVFEEFPLVEYAAKFWPKHARVSEEAKQTALPLSLDLLSGGNNALLNCVRFYDMIHHAKLRNDHSPLGPPLYHASIFGLPQSVTWLLQNGADVNVVGGHFGNPLQGALMMGQDHIARILVGERADINAKGGDDANALQTACSRGNVEMVQWLLVHKVNVNARGGNSGTALQAASSIGKIEMVQPLLNCGADVNIQGGSYGSALQAALVNGGTEVAKLLLDRGADINVEGRFGNALYLASERANTEIAKLLLDRGANVNMKGGVWGNVLQAASLLANTETAKLLLDRGADINMQGGIYGNALQAAAVHGKTETAKLLLDRGADINMQGGKYGNALQAAAVHGKTETAKLLLDRGADINMQGGEYGNALQAASAERDTEIAKLLLDRGADVNAEGGDYGSALNAALEQWNSTWDYSGVIRLLVRHGAEVNPIQGRRIYNKFGENFYHELGFKDENLGVADQDEVWDSDVSESE